MSLETHAVLLHTRPAHSPTLMPRAAGLLRLYGVNPRLDDPRVLRLQEAASQTDPVGDDVARFILASKNGEAGASSSRP